MILSVHVSRMRRASVLLAVATLVTAACGGRTGPSAGAVGSTTTGSASPSIPSDEPSEKPAATSEPLPTEAEPTVAAGVATFTVDYPGQGEVIDASPVEVGGRAPAGSRVVRDISLAPDDDAIAGTDDHWVMFVELDEGANELVFRLGDDESTEVRLGLTYEPASAPTKPPITPAPPAFRTFGDGTHEVGIDIKAGTYRLREPAGFCYWARLKGFSGELRDIIANENVIDAYGVVTIKGSDAGFESNGCDEWSSDLSRVTDSKSHIYFDGTYIVGTDIAAGRWKSTGGDYCYWARLSAFTGQLPAINANGLPDGPTIVTIRSTDKGFETTGCGTWTRQ